ncbi:eukaryotic translation initiation factor 5B-like [Silene latifolia]|uniref:eukaryotic translation initiation factor 5B-like n=1 Tax=Silene latifolia TaxID=37657 RepID=UPI003D777F59
MDKQGERGSKKKVKKEVKNDTSKVVEKKVPNHVMKMHAILAKRKEDEEKRKKEEAERLRKEEEERRMQEEIERQKEEAKRRKKEKEKEKIQRKRKEGKPMTAKQKEEQRRLEIIRKQFLSTSEMSLPAAEGVQPSKRPIYETKKGKINQGQANGAQTQTLEKMEEVGTIIIDVEEDSYDIQENSSDEKEEEKDNDQDWDTNSWDDTAIPLPVKGAFDDEETELLAQLTTTKESEKVVLSVPESQGKENCKEIQAKEETGISVAPTTKSESDLRSPICCIMGHVDAGKTKLLDCIRGTNVQQGEAGGITQQIGATYLPAANIRERTKELKADARLNVPGLLVIDTPGHESFTNLRSRGSGLCDIAILVVDIMHGLEPQTLESLNLLKMRNTEFIVALNKVDRLYGWKTCRNTPIIKAMKQQTQNVRNEFNTRLTNIITQFKEQGLNTELYYKNKEMGETFSIVPTSAISGEGIPDILLLLVKWSEKTMIEKLTFSNKVQCTVLEVKVTEGHGTTIDAVLVNGVLREGDQIVVCGMQGPIVTTIRALLTPRPMTELRVKGTYLHHKEIKAAQGIKITAQSLEHAIAGTGLYVVGADDDLEKMISLATEDMDSVMSKIDKSGEGVCVQASTLGSLEALLAFLKSPAVSIPVSAVSIGPIHKKDVMKAGVMLGKKKEYATILAFDVKATPEAREYADKTGVKIFMADIIYHLFDQFTAYIDTIKEEKKKGAANEAVFPCVLKIVPNGVFNKKDPILLGVDVLEGIVKKGTPICVRAQDFVDIGQIVSIHCNNEEVDIAKKGQTVAIKIVGTNPDEKQKIFGRHFSITDELVSRISRKSIDALKANYWEEISHQDKILLKKLKLLFKIQ